MVRDQIQAIVAQMLVIPPVSPATLNTAPGFIHGTSKEINYKADSQAVWPMVCLYPKQPVSIKLGKNGSADNWYNIYMEFLFKTNFDQDSDDNEPIERAALHLANKFLVDLRNYKETPMSATYFKWEEGTEARAMPVYNKNDVNNTGVSLTFKVKKRVDEYLLNC